MNNVLSVGFHLVVGLVFTALLVSNVENTSYSPVTGILLALLVGGGLTVLTVWGSLYFGRDGPAEDSSSGNDRPGFDGRDS